MSEICVIGVEFKADLQDLRVPKFQGFLSNSYDVDLLVVGEFSVFSENFLMQSPSEDCSINDELGVSLPPLLISTFFANLLEFPSGSWVEELVLHTEVQSLHDSKSVL